MCLTSGFTSCAFPFLLFEINDYDNTANELWTKTYFKVIVVSLVSYAVSIFQFCNLNFRVFQDVFVCFSSRHIGHPVSLSILPKRMPEQ